MSDLEKDPAELLCASQADGPVLELLAPREVVLGRTTKVRRLLPNKNRRMSAPGASSTTTAPTT
ncbi:hypothetical protein [Kribbella flavida]|uniref:hypothetical protein n=1 Tax=Kribbella flavida TaxID=182640 RepID=UPI00019BF66C|nr:hypothetical protein [Kribbella flavida]